jgi:hypothetical protein
MRAPGVAVRVKVGDPCATKRTNMRLTIVAGLITGASLAMQVTLSAHVRPKPIPPNSAIRIRVVAPWYIASNTSLPARCTGDGKNELNRSNCAG